MNEVFTDSRNVQCIFSDEGITLRDPHQEAYYPYGSLDLLKISLLGVLQVGCRAQICSFVVGREDRARMKQTIRLARDAMKTAPKGEPRILDLAQDDSVSDLSPQEQLQHYKAQFVQGHISKEEYEARKRQLRG